MAATAIQCMTQSIIKRNLCYSRIRITCLQFVYHFWSDCMYMHKHAIDTRPWCKMREHMYVPLFHLCYRHRHATWPYLTWPYLTLLYLTSPHLNLPYLALPCLTLPHFTLPHLDLPCRTLSYLALPYLPLPNLTIPCLTLNYNGF